MKKENEYQETALEEALESPKEEEAEDKTSEFVQPGQQYVKEHQLVPSRIGGKPREVSFGPLGGGLVPANPFASLAQAGYLHSHPEILGKKKLSEFDAATKGRSLPKRVKK